MLAVVRRDTADAEGPAGRDLKNAAFVALAGGMLLLGVAGVPRHLGPVEPGARRAGGARAAYAAEELGADVLGQALLVVATVAALAVTAAIVRHRDTLHEVRFTALGVCAAPVAVGAMTGSTVLLGVGAASFVLALVLSLRRRDPDG